MTFVDEGRRFATTSDDKARPCRLSPPGADAQRRCLTCVRRHCTTTLSAPSFLPPPPPSQTLRVWEYGIPVQIKYIADPSMQSMPAVTVHPNCAPPPPGRAAPALACSHASVDIASPGPQHWPDPSPHLCPLPSPAAQWLAAQSMDNQIVIYSCKERFRLNSKKRFAGHSNAGYACQARAPPAESNLLPGRCAAPASLR